MSSKEDREPKRRVVSTEFFKKDAPELYNQIREEYAKKGDSTLR